MGQVFAWGNNRYGQLGTGRLYSYKQVGTHGWTQVSYFDHESTWPTHPPPPPSFFFRAHAPYAHATYEPLLTPRTRHLRAPSSDPTHTPPPHTPPPSPFFRSQAVTHAIAITRPIRMKDGRTAPSSSDPRHRWWCDTFRCVLVCSCVYAYACGWKIFLHT